MNPQEPHLISNEASRVFLGTAKSYVGYKGAGQKFA